MSLRTLVYQKSGEFATITLDAISGFWAVLAVLFTTYVFTFVSTDILLAIKVIFLFSLIPGGITLHAAFVGPVQLKPFKFNDYKIFSTSVSIGIVSLILIQIFIFQLTPSPLATLGLPAVKAFFISAAVGEEYFFRYFLLPYFIKLSNAPLASNFVVSVLFAIYHNFIFGTVLSAILIVGVSSFIIGLLAISTKRMSVPLTLHGILNLIAG